MAGNNPELQAKLQELDHELEVRCPAIQSIASKTNAILHQEGDITKKGCDTRFFVNSPQKEYSI